MTDGEYDNEQAIQHLQGGAGLGVPAGVLHYENGTAGEIFNLIVVDRKFGKCYKIRNLFTDSDCEKLSIILETTFRELYKTLEIIKSGANTEDIYLESPIWHFKCAPINPNDISEIDLSKMELIFKL